MDKIKKKVFISYAHKDERFFRPFEAGLKSHLYTSNNFDYGTWEDSKIYPGLFWDEEIQDNLGKSDIAILCVTTNFYDSRYIELKEFGVLINKFPETLIIPIYFNHCNLGTWDELSKRQFFKPLGDRYDKGIKDEFAFCDLLNFSQTDGRIIPNSNIDLYLKDLVQKIELSIAEISKKKINNSALSKDLGDNKTYGSIIPKASKLFTGRVNEQKLFNEKFQQANLLCIAGLGGTGKSQFAAKIIESLPQEKIVWFDCKEDSTFESLIQASGYHDLLKVEGLNKIATFLGYKELIERDGKLIFIDNYHDYSDTQFEDFFKFLKNSLTVSKFTLISRERIKIDDVDLVNFTIEGLKEDSLEYAKKIIADNYNQSVSITDDKLSKICDDLLGHPFAIQMAIQLISYEGGDENILYIISQYQNEKNKLRNRLLDEIFNHQKSTEEEKNLLTCISVLRGEIEKIAIVQLFGANYNTPLAGLIDKLMMGQSNGKYLMHALVREFAYLKLTEKIKYHNLAFKYYAAKVTDSKSLETFEEIFYHLVKSENLTMGIQYFEENCENLLKFGYTKFLKKCLEYLMTNGKLSQKLHIALYDVYWLQQGLKIREGCKV